MEKEIRFIDTNYTELFRISDGGKYTIDYHDGNGPQERTAHYIDDYHFADNRNNVWHICEFAERMEECGATVVPVEVEKITAVLCQPMKKPKTVEIENNLKSLQKAVGGYIEVTYPWDDNVGIICNEEGKLEGFPLNRSLKDENGEIYDIIAGDFLIVGLGEEDFCSLSKEQINQYSKIFKSPEQFIRIDDKILSIPVDTKKAKLSI